MDRKKCFQTTKKVASITLIFLLLLTMTYNVQPAIQRRPPVVQCKVN